MSRNCRFTRWAGHSFYVLVAVALGASSTAFANDSSASLGTGGLSLAYNSHIEMHEEELYLSVREIRVRYRFFNKSREDIETLVAFPLPKIENGEGGNYGVTSADPVNFIGFEVMVDGHPVTPMVEARAVSMGVDVTKLLQKYDLPLTTITADHEARVRLNARMRDLPAEARRELERYGVMDWQSIWDKDNKPDANPRWTTHITFYWLQTFPAGRTIEVTHRYRPVPRRFIASTEEIRTSKLRETYCADAAFIRGVAAQEKAAGNLMGTELHYIISTAQNWSGPIKKFSLTIDKGSADKLASTCFKGLKKTGSTTFSVVKEDFWPQDDLGVLLIDKAAD